MPFIKGQAGIACFKVEVKVIISSALPKHARSQVSLTLIARSCHNMMMRSDLIIFIHYIVYPGFYKLSGFFRIVFYILHNCTKRLSFLLCFFRIVQDLVGHFSIHARIPGGSFRSVESNVWFLFHQYKQIPIHHYSGTNQKPS